MARFLSASSRKRATSFALHVEPISYETDDLGFCALAGAPHRRRVFGYSLALRCQFKSSKLATKDKRFSSPRSTRARSEGPHWLRLVCRRSWSPAAAISSIIISKMCDTSVFTAAHDFRHQQQQRKPKLHKRNRKRRDHSAKTCPRSSAVAVVVKEVSSLGVTEEESGDRSGGFARQMFAGTCANCVACHESLPEERNKWSFLACCGLGACRACLEDKCPNCGHHLPDQEKGLVGQLRAAADSGCVSSRFEFGQHMLHQQFQEDAAKYLALAASAGHVEAAFVLAFHLDDGGILDTDHTRAKVYYELAAEAGHAGAAMFLEQLRDWNHQR